MHPPSMTGLCEHQNRNQKHQRGALSSAYLRHLVLHPTSIVDMFSVPNTQSTQRLRVALPPRSAGVQDMQECVSLFSVLHVRLHTSLIDFMRLHTVEFRGVRDAPPSRPWDEARV